ncbi:MAG: HAD family hydrolase [Beijerinckiaceae bacterium]|nr:MAG: HAD family hydrolase [Beijerinckiaceae bacterium]
MTLEALIFDVDGTLAETEELHRYSFNESFRALGLDWVWQPDLYRELLQVTGGKERIRHYVERFAPAGGDMALARLGELHAEKTRRYGALVAQGMLKPRPGVARLLRETRAAGVKLAIATTSDPANVAALLRASFAPDAPAWFSVVGAGDIVAAKKPAPDVYLWVLERLRCEPSNAIAIEDSENGLRAARAAGLKVVATPGFYTDTDDFSGASAVFSDLGEPGAPARRLDTPGARDDLVDLAFLQKIVSR